MEDNLNTQNTSEEQNSDFYYEDITETNTPVSLSDFTDNEVHSFVRLSDKYNDITSSALTMLLVGLAGIVFMALVLLKVIPLPFDSETSWLFYSVMGGIFIIFAISGIVSFMHAKQVKLDAAIEDKLIEDMLNWADENLTKDFLDKDLDLTQSEELIYFDRAEKITNALMHEFENADEALIGELTEQIYQKFYEN